MPLNYVMNYGYEVVEKVAKRCTLTENVLYNKYL